MPLSETLNESPSQKEGKWGTGSSQDIHDQTLNESPSQKEGKYYCGVYRLARGNFPSMKVPPKRKGNAAARVYFWVFL